jgi:hypothetical protein
MRQRILAAIFAVLASLGMASQQPAQATCRYGCAPAGWGHVRTVQHWGYYPRYKHVYSVHYATDPYAYRYEPRGYYPYYNSGYWRSAHEMRARRAHLYSNVHVPYYQAWGYPKRGYKHREWHARHHGRIHIGHW